VFTRYRALTRRRWVVTQKPGYWVIACFMDTQDGREHTTLGMEKIIQILK